MSMQDVFLLGAFSVALIMTLFIAWPISNTFSSACSQVGASLGANANSTSSCNMANQTVRNFGETVPLVIGAGGMGAIILAYAVPLPPVFFVLGIFSLLVSVVIFFNVQSILPAVFSDPYLISSTVAFPLPWAILQYIVWFVGIVGLGILVVGYSKNKNSKLFG